MLVAVLVGSLTRASGTKRGLRINRSKADNKKSKLPLNGPTAC